MESKTKVEIINANVKKIIYNEPATIVFWGDGSKTVVKCMKDQPFNPYHGFTAALAKHIYGSSSAVNELVDAFAFSRPVEEKKPEPKKLYETPLKSIFHGEVRLYNWLIGQYTLTFNKQSDAEAYVRWAIQFIENHGWLTEEVALGETSDPRYTVGWLEDSLEKWKDLLYNVEYCYGKYQIDLPSARRFEQYFRTGYSILHVDYAEGVYDLTFGNDDYADDFLGMMMNYADANDNWCPENVIYIPIDAKSIDKNTADSMFGWTREDLLMADIHDGHLCLPKVERR
jgi:hypothetical protein